MAADATSQEVAEAMGVVIVMNGGPGTVWGAWAAAASRSMPSRQGDNSNGLVDV